MQLNIYLFIPVPTITRRSCAYATSLVAHSNNNSRHIDSPNFACAIASLTISPIQYLTVRIDLDLAITIYQLAGTEMHPE